jgi:hypothetical protein
MFQGFVNKMTVIMKFAAMGPIDIPPWCNVFPGEGATAVWLVFFSSRELPLVYRIKTVKLLSRCECVAGCFPQAHQWFGNLVTMEWWTDLWYVRAAIPIPQLRIVAVRFGTARNNWLLDTF